MSVGGEPDQAEGFEERPVAGRFEGQTVIVTGAASGIGRASALRLGLEGARVVAADASEQGLRTLVDAFPELGLVPVCGDVSREDDVTRMVAAADGRLDGLANVAGIMDEFHPVHEVTDEIWERVLRVNLTGLMRVTRACVPLMLAAGRGSIVNVASEAGLRGSAAGAAYTASKHAVVGLTRSSSVMYAPLGIRVNAVAPGPVRTAIQAPLSSQLGAERLGPLMQSVLPPTAAAAELAAVIAYLLSDDAPNITGAIVPSDGGWCAI